MKNIHGNNVVWLCAKYAVEAILFRLESSILMQAKRATNRNNVGGKYLGGELPVGGSNRGGNVREGIVHGGKFPEGKAPEGTARG